MIKVRIERDNPNDVIELVRELRKRGYTQGIDFDFAFVPVEIDQKDYHIINKKHTMFMFYKEEIASWFILLYQ